MLNPAVTPDGSPHSTRSSELTDPWVEGSGSRLKCRKLRALGDTLACDTGDVRRDDIQGG